MERLLGRLQRQKIRHPLIHARRAQRSPERDDQRPPVPDAQLLPGLFLRAGEKAAAHRRPRHHHPAGVAVLLPARLHADHDPVGEPLQQTGGQPRDHVGLVDGCGDARLGRCLDHGEAGVASRADDQLGLEPAQDAPGLVRRPEVIPHGDQVVPDLRRFERAVQAGDVDRLKGVSRLGDQILFQSPLRAHEQDLRLRRPVQHELSHRQRRVHVSRRPAAGEDHPLGCFSHINTPSKGLKASSAARRSARSPFPGAEASAPCRRS